MSNQKRSSWGLTPLVVLLLAVAALGGWMYKGPQRTVVEIQAAIKEGDIPALRKRIDFPTLRSNIKVKMAREISKATSTDGTTFGVGMELIGGVLLDKVIGQLVTPEWLVGAGMASSSAASSAEREAFKEKLKGAMSTQFKSLNEAHLVFRDEDGSFTLIFERNGLNWVLVDLDGDFTDTVN